MYPCCKSMSEANEHVRAWDRSTRKPCHVCGRSLFLWGADWHWSNPACHCLRSCKQKYRHAHSTRRTWLQRTTQAKATCAWSFMRTRLTGGTFWRQRMPEKQRLCMRLLLISPCCTSNRSGWPWQLWSITTPNNVLAVLQLSCVSSWVSIARRRYTWHDHRCCRRSNLAVHW